ncbi:MAG: hypothetical protein ABI808_00155 [Pseudonocardiales bacterium]
MPTQLVVTDAVPGQRCGERAGDVEGLGDGIGRRRVQDRDDLTSF